MRKASPLSRNEDVIVAKITPCFENGKAAICRGLTNGLGFGSTEFHVLRCTDAVIPEYIYHFVRQESFRRDGEANMTRFGRSKARSGRLAESSRNPACPVGRAAADCGESGSGAGAGERGPAAIGQSSPSPQTLPPIRSRCCVLGKIDGRLAKLHSASEIDVYDPRKCEHSERTTAFRPLLPEFNYGSSKAMVRSKRRPCNTWYLRMGNLAEATALT